MMMMMMINNRTSIAILLLCGNIPTQTALSKKLHKAGAITVDATFKKYGGMISCIADLSKLLLLFSSLPAFA